MPAFLIVASGLGIIAVQEVQVIVTPWRLVNLITFSSYLTENIVCFH